MTLGHVQPWSKGGRDGRGNLMLSSRRCNTFKGDRTLAEMALVLRRILDVLAAFLAVD